MEKRLLLSIILSFAVLYAWAALNPKKNLQNNNLQTIEDKHLTETTSPPVSAAEKLEETPPAVDQNEEITILETEKLKASFSSKGGNLKSIYVKVFGFSHPLTDYNSILGYENISFQLEEKTSRTITYSYTTSAFKLSKIYEISKNDYTITSSIIFKNISEKSNLVDIKINTYAVNMSNVSDKETDPDYERDKSLYEYLVHTAEKTLRKAGAYKFKANESKLESVPVIWTGFRSRYYCSIIKPQFDSDNYELKTASEDLFNIIIHPKQVSLLPGSQMTFNTVVYTGPENLDLLKSYNMDFEKVRKYYRFSLFDVAAKLIYSIMHLIHKVLPSWGLAIIFVSMIIYGATYPLTIKSMLSMKRMQDLAPKINSLKEKYKDNPQKMNAEMMDLYKKNKINPLGGCLPMILQMPIFIGLYQVLWRSVEFKGAGFLWIKDLTKPDALFTFPFNLPLIGNEFNILPLVMMVIMFFQQKFSMKNMVSTDPSQIAQQKMMANIMPIFLGVIFYKFASGLTLYFTLFYLFSTFTQFKMTQTKKVVLHD